VECVEDGGGGGVASAEFAGEVEGVGDSQAGEVMDEVANVEEKKEKEPAGRRRYGRAVEAYCWSSSGASGGSCWRMI
jgi:hypothetical protein